ncbi:MAG: TIGR03087 family PEP-CTERM/XrtA system glycosyltransferase [Pseudomonadota bacterium]
MGDILFLAHRVPFPPNRGDTIRSANLLRKLAGIAPVHVGCFSEGNEQQADLDELASLSSTHLVVRRSKPLVLAGAEAVLSGKPVSLTAFQSPKFAKWVRDTIASRDIETVVVFSGQMGQYVPEGFAGRLVIDLCDVDSAKFQNYAEAGDRVWLNEREGRLLALEEERLARRADATILISDHEADLFRSRLQFPSMASIHVVGNGIDAHVFDPSKAEVQEDISLRNGPHFVFTGQMDYPPNEAAALWAAEHFLPVARERFAQAEFHIVGRAPTKPLLALEGTPGLTIWGEVPDVRPFLASATCVIAPLQIARGVQNKVLEAMAMARPVVVTPQAATGIAAHDGKQWLLAKADARQMVEKIAPVIEDQSRAKALGASARQFVLDHHGWDAMLAPLETLVRGSREGDRNAA